MASGQPDLGVALQDRYRLDRELGRAARRRAPDISLQLAANEPESASLLVDYLREEGRLAALTGDTAGAIRAYTHYLALREDPDHGPWRAERDEVKRELGDLIGEAARH